MEMKHTGNALRTILAGGTIFGALSMSALAAPGDQPNPTDKFKNLEFREIGPATMGGRIDDFAVVESNPNIVYVGTASGGVWKTTNNGTTWEPIFDKESVSTIGDGAIAMSPIVDTLSLSNIGSHVVPLLVVFHTPPEAVPTYTMFGLLSTTAKSSMRPPMVAGPISRNSRFLNLSAGFLVSPAAAPARFVDTPKKSFPTTNSPRRFPVSILFILPATKTPSMIRRGRAEA